ncbi:RNA polymerase sigma factor [Pedobacter sp. AW31-3R]|uniref:RNA polymerase sigma factor n=1 Tax=Pedobacter sp. AW31-3R TaxID=3445781 RepID=UPI003FA0576F
MDTKIISNLREGNLTVFNTVYELYHPQIYSFINHKTQSDFLAEEVVQLTFIRLWQQREALQENVELNIQLFGMARQVMIDELRKEATRSRHNSESALNPFSDSLMKMIESRDMLKHFEDEIENLPRIRKMVFNLSRKQGLSHKEIAEILSISPKTVEAHIGKVLSRLRQYMYSIFL